VVDKAPASTVRALAGFRACEASFHNVAKRQHLFRFSVAALQQLGRFQAISGRDRSSSNPFFNNVLRRILLSEKGFGTPSAIWWCERK